MKDNREPRARTGEQTPRSGQGWVERCPATPSSRHYPLLSCLFLMSLGQSRKHSGPSSRQTFISSRSFQPWWHVYPTGRLRVSFQVDVPDLNRVRAQASGQCSDQGVRGDRAPRKDDLTICVLLEGVARERGGDAGLCGTKWGRVLWPPKALRREKHQVLDRGVIDQCESIKMP